MSKHAWLLLAWVVLAASGCVVLPNDVRDELSQTVPPLRIECTHPPLSACQHP